MDKLGKVKDLQIPTAKRERNYLKRMNLQDARVWFRYRCKITAHIKGNKSSMYKDKMRIHNGNEEKSRYGKRSRQYSTVEKINF